MAVAYQDTPAASKRNAFCWHQWEPRIDWNKGAAQERGGRTRSRQIDAERAQGREPLFIAGLGSAAMHNPLDAARFAIATARRTAHAKR